MISIVIPVYNEAKKIKENIKEIIKYIKKYSYEMIIVDDGSKDNTWNCIKELNKENENIKGVRFSRNFGKEIALCAGVDITKGDAIITMDSDLQHDPKYIDEMISAWKNGAKIVEGIRKNRQKQSILYKCFANLFYNTLKKLTKLDLKNSLDFKLLDREVVESIKKLHENNVFFRGLVEWVGYEKVQILMDVGERKGDTSKFTLKSLSRLAIIAITSFSSSLLNIVLILSSVFMLGAILLAIQTLCNKIFGNAVDGFTTVIILLLVTGSCVLLSLGIIGIYISKIYNEVKERPRYIISEKV